VEFSAIFACNSGNAINPGGGGGGGGGVQREIVRHTHVVLWDPWMVEIVHVGVISFDRNVKIHAQNNTIIYRFAFVL
jgi:hypothetical protein